MYKDHWRCRACNYGGDSTPTGIKAVVEPQRLIPMLDLGVQPLANDFRKPGEEHSGYAPLKLLYCPRCTLGQLSVVVRPEILYAAYPYVTSPSETMRDHFERLTADILTEQNAGSVIEIGSNDGLFLDFLSAKGFGNVCGIDPASNLHNGKRTIAGFLTPHSAALAQEGVGKVDLVVARHVFGHIDDWADFLICLDFMCNAQTLICIEVPWIMDQLKTGSFDQVYHEHLSYVSVKSIKYLLTGRNYHLHRVIHYDIHGGSIVLMIRRNDSTLPVHPSVAKFIGEEDHLEERYKKFPLAAKEQINGLIEFVLGGSRRVCGYGASAKATVWINACRFTKKQVEFVCDSTRLKIHTRIPGTDIPVVHEGDHYTSCVDYVILFAWNFAREIMERERKMGHRGFKWIIPVPKLQVIDAA